ncbi:DsbA family protein [Tianweitania sp. BSSL-BM11]|uniref:DsbA family protein n=1 Tax=Tianweitania aestuarii TaxID=2814886 RepID=A0ABS5RUD1_9HYPH|nr:DsbA family protein [Tianweitania aestuarii]MBS9720547.1 DsbA family protein [Tianweitania aestuarii]
MKKILLGLTGTVMALALLGGGYAAGRVNADPSPEATPQVAQATDRAETESIIRDYLLSNPEILIEVQTALTARDQEAQQKQQAEVLQNEKAAIYQSANDAIIGNPEGSKTVVEFFDYNCGYCKHALADMQAMVQDDPDLRFIMKEFPILGPDSQQAHMVAAAFKRVAADKYAEFHIRLLGGSGRASEASALRLAASMGVEEAALRQAMKDPAIVEEFTQTFELANKLAISGTPAYVIGDEVVSGAIGADALKSKVEAVSAVN